MIETKEMVEQLIGILGSSEALALQLNKSWSAVYSWKTGKRTPSRKTIEQINKLYKKTMSRVAEKLSK